MSEILVYKSWKWTVTPHCRPLFQSDIVSSLSGEY